MSDDSEDNYLNPQFNKEEHSQINLSNLSSINEYNKYMRKPKLNQIKKDITLTVKGDNIFIKKRYGNLLSFKYIEGNPTIVIGKYFIICLIINIIPQIYIINYYYGRTNKYLWSIGIPIFIMQTMLFILTSTTNPGLPKAEYEISIYDDNKNAFRQCKDCKMWINSDEGTQHCTICDICIEGYDHHCSWMNICIGKNNLKLFYYYVLATALFIIYSVIAFLSHSNKK